MTLPGGGLHIWQLFGQSSLICSTILQSVSVMDKVAHLCLSTQWQSPHDAGHFCLRSSNAAHNSDVTLISSHSAWSAQCPDVTSECSGSVDVNIKFYNSHTNQVKIVIKCSRTDNYLLHLCREFHWLWMSCFGMIQSHCSMPCHGRSCKPGYMVCCRCMVVCKSWIWWQPCY